MWYVWYCSRDNDPYNIDNKHFDYNNGLQQQFHWIGAKFLADASKNGIYIAPCSSLPMKSNGLKEKTQT